LGNAASGPDFVAGKAKKILVFKKKRRKGYRRRQGHRQLFTAVQIQEIIV
jgi:large subunit ribosomal protein L21